MNITQKDTLSNADIMEFEDDMPPDNDIVREFRTRLEEQKSEDLLCGYFKYELSLYRCIASGDIKSLKDHLRAATFHLYCSDKTGDNLSETKHQYTGEIAIITRAAIFGGLPAIYAYTLGDVYAEKVRTCTSSGQLWHYFNMAIYDFTRRVEKSKLKSVYNYKVMESTIYISSHIFEKITLKKTAAHCCITPPYLSSIFKENIGMNFNEYVKQEKMKMAAMLLVDGNYSILEIADKLSISSSSAFSNQFRSVYGVTPSKFRSAKSRNKISNT